MFFRQLIVIIEDRKVHPDVFLKIQADALADVKGAQESLATACRFLVANGLGKGFSLRYILEQLGKLGLDLKKRPARIDDDQDDTSDSERMVLNNKFLLSTLKFAEFQVLRDIKHRARIPVKDSHVLVGVADEGPEYRSRGIRKINEQKVYCLTGNDIFGAPWESSSKRMFVAEGVLQFVYRIVMTPSRGTSKDRA